MFISEYKLYDKRNRKLCDLRNHSEIIKKAFEEILPEAFVGVEKRRYLVFSREKITREQAKEISNKLFELPSLARWHGYNGNIKRLMERTNEIPLSKLKIQKLYYISEEEEQNG